MTLLVTLFAKPGCHLCEQVAADLQQLQRDHPHELHEIDITANPALMERYGERIPVLEIGGREFAAPLAKPTLEWALRHYEQHAP